MIVSPYIGSNGSSVISGFGPRSGSRVMFSLASKASLYCNLHFFHRRCASGVGFSQKASIPGGVSLFANCALSYSIKLTSVSAREDTSSIVLGFH